MTPLQSAARDVLELLYTELGASKQCRGCGWVMPADVRCDTRDCPVARLEREAAATRTEPRT